MNSDNQLLWVLVIILVVIIAIIFWKRKSARPSEEDESDETRRMIQDCVTALGRCRTIDEFEVKLPPLLDLIISERMSPENDFGLTEEHLAELRAEVLQTQARDEMENALKAAYEASARLNATCEKWAAQGCYLQDFGLVPRFRLILAQTSRVKIEPLDESES